MEKKLHVQWGPGIKPGTSCAMQESVAAHHIVASKSKPFCVYR